MSTMASQITSLAIVYSTVYSGADKSKTSKLHFQLLDIKHVITLNSWKRVKYLHETTLSCVVNLSKSQYYLV